MVLDRCDIRLFHCTLLIMKSSILYFKLMWHSERSERSARSFCKYSSVPPKVTAVINCSFYSRAFYILCHSTLRRSAVMTGQSPKDTKTNFQGLKTLFKLFFESEIIISGMYVRSHWAEYGGRCYSSSSFVGKRE